MPYRMSMDWQMGEMLLSGNVTDGWRRHEAVEQRLRLDREQLHGSGTLRFPALATR